MIENLLNRLDGVRQTKPGRWVARCPAHQDKDPSLSLAETDDRVLIHCFAGCHVDDVVSAVGLEITDLFPPREVRDRPIKRTPDYRGMWLLARRSYYVMLLGMDDMLNGKQLSQADMEAVSSAAVRIRQIIEVLDHE